MFCNSVKKGFFKNFAKFAEKHLCQSLVAASIFRKKYCHINPFYATGLFLFVPAPPPKKKKAENQKETRGIKCVNISQELPHSFKTSAKTSPSYCQWQLNL